MSLFSQGHALLIGVGGDLRGTVHDGRRLVCLLTNDEFVFSPAAEMLEYDFCMSKTR